MLHWPGLGWKRFQPERPIRNAQIAAVANFELARVRAAFEAAVARMSISHMSNAGPGDTCSTG